MEQSSVSHQDGLMATDFEAYDTVGTYTRPYGWVYLGWLLTVTMVLTILLRANLSGFSEGVVWLGAGLYVLVAIIHFLRTLVLKGNWFAPDIVFFLVFGLFHFGYVIPYLLHLVPYNKRIFYAAEVVNPSVLFSALCGVLFLVGYEMAGVVRPRVIYRQPPITPGDIALYAGRILFVLGAAMQIFAIFQLGLENVMRSGFFAEAALAGKDVRFWSMGGNFLSLGLILYTVTNIHVRGKLFTGYLFPIVVLGRVGLVFMSGRRFDLLLAVIPFVLVYHYFKKPIKTKYLIIAFFVALFFVEVTRVARSIEEYSLGAFVKAVQEVETPILTASAEAGRSLETLNQTMRLIQAGRPHWYGRSYYIAFVRVIPNVLPGLRVSHVGPSIWLTQEMIKEGIVGKAGVGNSMATEAYLNFGFFGALVLLVIGAFHRILYDAVLAKLTLVRMMVLMTAVTHLFIWPRQWCGAYVRHVAWAFIIALIVQYLSGRRESRTLG